jgi:hypothetical protein
MTFWEWLFGWDEEKDSRVETDAYRAGGSTGGF